MRNLYHKLVITTLVIMANPVYSLTYYVSPSGSDSSTGTISSPFKTLPKVNSVAHAGDTFYMRGGTYNIPSQVTFSKSGTSSARIKLLNQPGEHPVLDATSMAGANGDRILKLSSASWWHIKGIEMRNNPRGGALAISFASTNNIVEGLNTHHNGRSSPCCAPGIAIYHTSANNLILNNDAHHNRDTTGGNADGIVVSGDTNSGNVLRGNRVWRNSDDGFDLWNSANVTLDNNWAWENGLDDNLQPLGNGQGFKLGGGGAGDGRHTLRNNVSWKNKANGFDYNSADLPITLYNNTAWNNRAYSYIFRNVQNTFRNNVSFGNLGQISGSDTFNSWTLGITVSATDFTSMDDSCARGPRQSSGALPFCPFLRLASGSKLIDRGTPVGIPYNGAAPDLGAFER